MFISQQLYLVPQIVALCTILQEEVTRNNQQIQCLQNQLNTTKTENQYLQITTQNIEQQFAVLGTVVVK
jgi:hypothetical protein